MDILAPNLTLKGLLQQQLRHWTDCDLSVCLAVGIGLSALPAGQHRLSGGHGLESGVLSAQWYAVYPAQDPIPFLPLLALHTVCILRAVFQREIQARLWPGIVLLGASFRI